MCILFFPVLLVLLLFRLCFIIVNEDFFPAKLKRADSFAPFCDLHHTTQSCIVLATSSQLSFPCSCRLSRITSIRECFLKGEPHQEGKWWFKSQDAQISETGFLTVEESEEGETYN